MERGARFTKSFRRRIRSKSKLACLARHRITSCMEACFSMMLRRFRKKICARGTWCARKGRQRSLPGSFGLKKENGGRLHPFSTVRREIVPAKLEEMTNDVSRDE